MNILDILKLTVYEMKHNKKECALSCFLQFFSFVCIFLLLILAANLPSLSNAFFHQFYPTNAGISFKLTGYTADEVSQLSKYGFYDFSFSEEGVPQLAYINDISPIWHIIISSSFSQKSLWNPNVNELLRVFVFLQTIIFFLAFIITLLVLLGLNNSIKLKFQMRGNYIKMLYILGYHPSSVSFVFAIYYFARTMVSLIFSVPISVLLMGIINSYLCNRVAPDIALPAISVSQICIITSIMFSLIIFQITQVRRFYAIH